MKIEHVALNVSDPNATGRWYVEHLGLTIVRRVMEPPWAHFLADDSGTVMLEIYGNTDFPVGATETSPPAALHFAFVSANVPADAERLVKAGATMIGEIDEMANGDVLAMLRDPWGVPIQLVKRGTSMI